MNHIDQAEKLLLMASKDMKAMELMISPESTDDEIFEIQELHDYVLSSVALIKAGAA